MILTSSRDFNVHILGCNLTIWHLPSEASKDRLEQVSIFLLLHDIADTTGGSVHTWLSNILG
jgi:hypothetical protein